MGEEIHGRTALEEFYRQTFETFQPKLSDYIYECRFSGENVFVRESWKITMHPSPQEVIRHQGKGPWIGKKEADGVWRTFWALADDEDIISVLKGDNRLVRQLGLNRPQKAKLLFHVWNMILKEIETKTMTRFASIQHIYCNGGNVDFSAEGCKGRRYDSLLCPTLRVL
jgi:hypothetical protein